jgi:hypothetical protein
MRNLSRSPVSLPVTVVASSRAASPRVSPSSVRPTVEARLEPVAPDLARALNKQIRTLAKLLGGREPGHKYGFLCECGCGETVQLTANRFDRDGAWLDGHKPD